MHYSFAFLNLFFIFFNISIHYYINFVTLSSYAHNIVRQHFLFELFISLCTFHVSYYSISHSHYRNFNGSFFTVSSFICCNDFIAVSMLFRVNFILQRTISSFFEVFSFPFLRFLFNRYFRCTIYFLIITYIVANKHSFSLKSELDCRFD